MTVLILAMRVKPRARRLAAWISMGHRAAATRAAYATPKAGLHMLVRVLAQELVDDGIAVKELVPGPVLTAFIAGRVEQLRQATGNSEWFKTPEDVVPMALFLVCSRNGGRLARHSASQEGNFDMRERADTHYTALVVEQPTPDFSGVALRTLPLELAGPQQVLIRVRAAALNYPDVLLTQGTYQFKPLLPFVPGLEASGEVVSVGAGVSHVRPGDAVVAQTRQGGALGQMMVADASEVRPMPANLDWDEASAYSAAGMTAYVSLVHRAQLAAGETLLVHGASGGTGLATVQLGRHLGARVIATGRSPEKLEMARAMGAHEVVQLGANLRDEILRLTDGQGADVVFDPVGGDVFDASLRALAWGGRLLVVGFVGGRIADLKSNYVLIKNVSVIGVRAGEFVWRDRARGARVMQEVDALAAQGVLKPHVAARFALQDSVQALRTLARGLVIGKIVVTM